jgi:hypothetical protein
MLWHIRLENFFCQNKPLVSLRQALFKVFGYQQHKTYSNLDLDDRSSRMQNGSRRQLPYGLMPLEPFYCRAHYQHSKQRLYKIKPVNYAVIA